MQAQAQGRLKEISINVNPLLSRASDPLVQTLGSMGEERGGGKGEKGGLSRSLMGPPAAKRMMMMGTGTGTGESRLKGLGLGVGVRKGVGRENIVPCGNGGVGAGAGGVGVGGGIGGRVRERRLLRRSYGS